MKKVIIYYKKNDSHLHYLKMSEAHLIAKILGNDINAIYSFKCVFVSKLNYKLIFD